MTGYDKALRAVLRVGDGRGFVVEHNRRGNVVITAGHCLTKTAAGSHLPPCHTGSFLEERTYERLLGPLNAEPTVWAECLFVDPIADLAVLGAPDSQTIPDEYEQYETLMAGMTPLRIAKARADALAFLLSLDRRWLPCRACHLGGPLWIKGWAKTVGGMSGSPIIDENCRAIGVVCTGSGGGKGPEDGPHARLMLSLPRWMTERR